MSSGPTEEISSSIRIYDENRKTLEEMYNLRAENPRLGWDHLPIYHKVKYLSETFSKYGGVFVVAPFLEISARDLMIHDGFESYIAMEESGKIDFARLSLEELLELVGIE